MKTCFKGFAATALLLAITALSAAAEDAPAAASPAPTQAAPADAKPTSVPRPSIAPRATEAAPETTSEPGPRRHRRYARHHHRRYAFWSPSRSISRTSIATASSGTGLHGSDRGRSEKV